MIILLETFFNFNGSPTIIYDGEELPTIANVNKKTAYIAGSTLNVTGAIIDQLRFSGALTYTKGEAYDTKQPLSSIPPLFGDIELGYQLEQLNIAVNMRFNGRKKLDDYNLIEGIDNIDQTPYNPETDTYYGTPSWQTINFFSKYSFNEHIDLQLNIDNILDQHYKEFASGISAPGRNFSVTLFLNN